MTWSICVARQTDLSAALINHTWNRLSVVSRIALQDLATLFLSKDAISCLFCIFRRFMFNKMSDKPGEPGEIRELVSK